MALCDRRLDGLPSEASAFCLVSASPPLSESRVVRLRRAAGSTRRPPYPPVGVQRAAGPRCLRTDERVVDHFDFKQRGARVLMAGVGTQLACAWLRLLSIIATINSHGSYSLSRFSGHPTAGVIYA